MSCAPDLVQDANQNQYYAAPNKDDCLFAIVSHERHIVLDVWIWIEKLMSTAPDEDSAKQKHDHSQGECDAERGNSCLLDPRYHQQCVDLHRQTVSTRFIGCCGASVGFFDATEGGMATPPFEINHRYHASSVPRQNRFRIRGGNFARRDLVNSSDQCTDQE